MNELTPLTRARAYVRDLINGRMGDWCGYSKSRHVRRERKVSRHTTTNECIELVPADWQKECITS
mgnify:CR=1 FL=1|jgi:hypothetical protein